MKYYKLTNKQSTTFNDTQWGEGITHQATVKGKTLCTNQVIHVYASPLLAAFLNPIHVDFRNPRLWECECSRPVADDGMKLGVKSCTTLRKVPPPKVTTEQRVKFAILCALAVYHATEFVLWADGWLTGKDRSKNAAREAAYAAARAARAAACETAREAACEAARAAAYAAYEAVRAARAAARETACEAARAARAAARAAAYKLNLSKIAEEAVR